MFERFTDRARRVVVLAQEEARLLNHDYIGTEHLLLGLMEAGEGPAAGALGELGVDHGKARAEVERLVGRGDGDPVGAIPFTAGAKKALELSLREALKLGHNYIGPEHILLGLLSEDADAAIQVLTALGVGRDAVRSTTLELLRGPQASAEQRPPVVDALCPACRLPLADRLGVQSLAVTVGASASIEQQVLVAYCRSCGCSIGLVAAAPPSASAPTS